MFREFKKSARDFGQSIPKTGIKLTRNLPQDGWKKGTLVKKLEELDQLESINKSKGQYSGSVYSTEKDLIKLNADASNLFLSFDLHHPQIFKYTKQLEREIVSMMLTLYEADDNCSGMVSNGGSESLGMAVLAHKMYYRNKKGITAPEVIVCETVHSALYKACDFYNVKLIPVDITKDSQVNVEGIRKRINQNTVLIVASCPNYPYGYIDPVEPLAKMARENDIGFHIDACMGGFLVPFAQEVGIEFPEKKYNFLTKGVTSISMDPHKYGHSAKGISIMLFSNKKIQQSLYFAKADGPGPAYASGKITDSLNGSVVAACWATMMSYGYEGYLAMAKNIMHSSQKLVSQIREIKGLGVTDDPKLGNISIVTTEKGLSIHSICNFMSVNGWHLGCTPKYPTMHLTLHYNNMSKMDNFIKLLKEGVEAIRADKKAYLKGPTTVVKEITAIPPSIAVRASQFCYFEIFRISNLEKTEESSKK